MKEPTVDARDVARFRDLIRERTGMTFGENRTRELTLAIRTATADAGLPSASALYDLVARRPGIGVDFDALASALNVSETHFFRDRGQMEDLRTAILPELVARRRASRTLRIWSAGCSTGEEPYTLAILLRQLVPDLPDWDVLILATDINGASLERARLGVYREWSFRAAPQTILGRDVVRRGNRFEVAPAVRRMVTFARLNLAEPVYPSVHTNTYGMDLILCRNVLLYFDLVQAREVVARLRSSLDDAGRLIVSRVDSSLQIFEWLTTEEPGSGVFRKIHALNVASEEPPGPVPRPWPVPPDSKPRTAQNPVRFTETFPQRQPSERAAPVNEPSKASSADVGAVYEAVLSAWKSGRDVEARTLLDRALSGHPLHAPLHYLEGLILLAKGDVADAAGAFRRAIYADGQFALAHLGQGTAFARAGLMDRANTALETASRLVADLDPETTIFEPEGLTAGEVLEIVAAQRALLGSQTFREPLDA